MIRNLYATAINWDDVGTSLGGNLLGLGCEQTDHDKIMADIAASGKPVSYIGIQESGGPRPAVAKGVEIAEKYQAAAAALPRKEFPLSKLVLAVQCGGSDWTTALSGNITIGEMTDLVVEEGGSVIIGEVPGFPGSEHILAERSVTPQVGLGFISSMVWPSMWRPTARPLRR